MSIDFLPKLTGCFAMPAAENPTVAMVEAAYRHHKIHARYITCEVPSAALGDAVRGAKAMGWIGFNCSLPHKVAVIDHLDGLGDSASLIGAVNTIVRRDDRWIGENTDGCGFVEALRAVVDPAGKIIVMFGAGGAARAVAVELALAGASHIVVVNRSRARAEPLVALINEKTRATAELVEWPSAYRVPQDAHVVINATSIGLFPDVDGRPDIDVGSLRPSMIAADLIPNPPRTVFLKEAAGRGCRTLDGLGMLVNQGVIGIRYWTGVDVDPAVMRKALSDVLSV
jgi:shikimate dehydrogenase